MERCLSQDPVFRKHTLGEGDKTGACGMNNKEHRPFGRREQPRMVSWGRVLLGEGVPNGGALLSRPQNHFHCLPHHLDLLSEMPY